MEFGSYYRYLPALFRNIRDGRDGRFFWRGRFFFGYRRQSLGVFRWKLRRRGPCRNIFRGTPFCV
jgi:hypothetical protein